MLLPSYFPMDGVKRCLVCLVCATNCLTFALLCAALTTHQWTVVRPVRTGLNVSLAPHHDDPAHRFQGLIRLGLFGGTKVLNYGFGNRANTLTIVCSSELGACMYSAKENATERMRDLRENFFSNDTAPPGDDEGGGGGGGRLPSFSLWVVCVSCLSLSAMFSVTGAALSALNALRDTSPETVTGFLGILVWNALGAACSLASACGWLAQHVLRLRRRALTAEELRQHWRSEWRAAVGLSFHLLLLACALSLVACAALAAILRQPWVHRRLRAELRKKLSSPSSTLGRT